ncbi:hypothetical protein DFH28DRAFT_884012, partial [Melampsora americana]
SDTLKTGQPVQVGDFVAEVRCSNNVQHNCYDPQCKSVRSVQPLDKLSLQPLAPKESVVHQQTDLFIINSASLYNGQAHHEWAHIEPQRVEPKAWVHATQSGLGKWKNESLRIKSKCFFIGCWLRFILMNQSISKKCISLA